jgi:hypothetical protein
MFNRGLRWVADWQTGVKRALRPMWRNWRASSATLIGRGLLHRAVRPRILLIADNLCLRHQLFVLQRRKARPRLKDADRWFWVLACRWLVGWRTSLVRLCDAPKLERSSQYPCLEASITSISRPHDVPDRFFAPYSWGMEFPCAINETFLLTPRRGGKALGAPVDPARN